jgi:putative transcriptional regulator
MYTPIEIDRDNLTIMGVKFPDLQTLENTAYAVGSNMFEGFQPTPEIMTVLRDFVTYQLQHIKLYKYGR